MIARNASLAAAALLFVIQPAAAQRMGPSQRGPANLPGQALLDATQDVEEFATGFELTAEQQSRLQGLVDAFRAEHGEALESVSALRDSMRTNWRDRDRAEQRSIMRDQAEQMRQLRPAMTEFEQQVGDILTWNQGREVAASFAPGRFAARMQRDGRRVRGYNRMNNRGPRGFRGRPGFGLRGR